MFENHTVNDNLLLATKAPRTVWTTLGARRDTAIDKVIDNVLARIRLTDVRDRQAGSLSHGQKQWLKSACCSRRTPSCCWSTSPSPA